MFRKNMKAFQDSNTVSGKVLSCSGLIIETQINFIAIYKQILRCAELPWIRMNWKANIYQSAAAATAAAAAAAAAANLIIQDIAFF